MCLKCSLRKLILSYRPYAIRRGEALYFRQMPLFVLLAHHMEDGAISDCIEYAIDDGYGDPDDLNPRDRRQTSRFESAIFQSIDSNSITELLTIEYGNWRSGHQLTLCRAVSNGVGILTLLRWGDVPSFYAFGIGGIRETLYDLRREPEVLLPRHNEDGAPLLRVAIHQPLPWTFSDSSAIVKALTGVEPSEHHLVRTDLLIGAQP